MGDDAVRWALLVVVISAILGAMQCPHTPPRSGLIRSPWNSLGRRAGKAISGKLLRGPSRRRTLRSPSGSGNESSGSESDGEHPASGNDSMGRLPRSRSPTPAPGGGAGTSGGGASTSGGGATTSSGSAVSKLNGTLSLVKINSLCRTVNQEGDAHVVNDMTVSMFANIIQTMSTTAQSDKCDSTNRVLRQEASRTCQEMFSEFKKIPPVYRGECRDAINALCIIAPAAALARPSQAYSVCTFFVPTEFHAENQSATGYYIAMSDCITGIKDQLFMDDQLSRVGIKPPTSPPQPLLPPYYSPQN